MNTPEPGWLVERPEWLKKVVFVLVLGVAAATVVVGVVGPRQVLTQLRELMGTPSQPDQLPLGELNGIQPSYRIQSGSESMKLPFGINAPKDLPTWTVSQEGLATDSPCASRTYIARVTTGILTLSLQSATPRECFGDDRSFDNWLTNALAKGPTVRVEGPNLTLTWYGEPPAGAEITLTSDP